MTQHRKIIEMCLDGKFHCQNEFRGLYIFSPHKRREEIEKGEYKNGRKGQYTFETRPCIHGVANQFDYRMVRKLSPYEEMDLKVKRNQVEIRGNQLTLNI